MYWFSVFSNNALTPGSLKNLIKALFFGKPLCARNNAIPASFSLLPNAFFASDNAELIYAFCAFTNFSTLGFNAKNSWLSPFGVGPEMINGVLASSIKTESTSSTIAKL